MNEQKCFSGFVCLVVDFGIVFFINHIQYFKFPFQEIANICLYRQRLENLKIEEYEKQRQREEKRKEKYLKKLREQEQQQLSSKIRSEEKKLLIAQRKLESIRVLEALFDRIKVKKKMKIFKKKSIEDHWRKL